MRNMGKNFIKLLFIFGLLLFGFGVSVFLYQSTYNQEMKIIKNSREKQLVDYKKVIDTKTDPYILTVNGTRYLKKNLPDLAIISLERTTQIEKGYRDGWLALGLAQLELADYKSALSSFQEAEKIDPINAKTYEYLEIAYKKLEQSDSAARAQTKYEFLTKTKQSS